MAHVLVGIGSNLGNAAHNIDLAISHVADLPHFQLLKTSALVRSRAVGGPENQSDYLNAVILAETDRPPIPLVHLLLGIERAMGRQRTELWGPRIIDLDLLCHGDSLVQSDVIVVPHPWMSLRSFVMRPCQQIAPDFVHPLIQLKIEQLWQQLSDPAGRVVVLPTGADVHAWLRTAIHRVCLDSPWEPSPLDGLDLPTLIECAAGPSGRPNTAFAGLRALVVFDRKQPPVGWDQVWQERIEPNRLPRAPFVSLSIADVDDAERKLRIILAAITAVT